MQDNGFQYFFSGLRLICHPKLRAFVLIPLLCNILLFVVFTVITAHYFGAFVDWLLSYVPHWLRWLDWILWLLFAIADLIIMAYAFTLLANIIAAPFNALLAEKVQELLTGNLPDTPQGLLANLKALPKNLARAGQWLIYYLPRAIILLVLFVIPGVNIVAPILWFIFNGWTMSVQYMDYPADNNHLSFKQMRQRIGQQRLQHLSFGIVVLIFTMIPIVNLIVMPAAVAGATNMWLSLHQK